VSDFKIGDLVWVIKQPDKVWVCPLTGKQRIKKNGTKFKGKILDFLPKKILVELRSDSGKTAVRSVEARKVKARGENETL
jgi:hypothetical protein